MDEKPKTAIPDNNPTGTEANMQIGMAVTKPNKQERVNLAPLVVMVMSSSIIYI